ncbi:ankyrin repeat protein [Elusimicrobium simillimum]|uniref:ankyrin repeat domain-containing protein n=1 Tax=Elusimicrobium simillimum TaxID=3143438 RepID=UPI003C705E4A
MKKTLVIALSLFLCFSVTACKKKEDTQAKQKMGYQKSSWKDQHPLFIALHSNDMDAVKQLVDKTNVNERILNPETGRAFLSPLTAAITTGNADAVKYFISQGAAISAIDGEYFTPLSLAAIKGNFEIVKILGDAKANAKEGYPLIDAVAGERPDNVEITKYLISIGAPVNGREDMGNTALNMAVSWGKLGSVKALVAAGADVNSYVVFDGSVEGLSLKGSTPLSSALDFIGARPSYDMVKFLVDNGASVVLANEKSLPEFPFYIDEDRAENEQEKEEFGKINALLKREIAVGKKVKPAQDAWFNSNPVYKAILDGNLEQVKKLINKKNVNNSAANTAAGTRVNPLIFAVAHGQREIAAWLISQGANVNFDTGKNTPLSIAAAGNKLQMVVLLVSNKADVNKYTPLAKAVQRNNYSIAAHLLEHGADVNIEDENVYSPLMLAVNSWGCDLDLVELLVKNGAAVNAYRQDAYGNIRFNSGMTPLGLAVKHCAIQDDGYDIIKYLVDNGADALFAAEVSQEQVPLSKVMSPKMYGDKKFKKNIKKVNKYLELVENAQTWNLQQ